jgi:hypothetical protein
MYNSSSAKKWDLIQTLTYAGYYLGSSPSNLSKFGLHSVSSNHAEGVMTVWPQLHWPWLVIFNKGGAPMIQNKGCVLISDNSNFPVMSLYKSLLFEATD